MSTIEFKDLNESIGTELFTDTESFLEDLGDDAVNVVGGNSNMQTTLYRQTTTHYIPFEGELHPAPRYSTIILQKPHIPLHPRPVHPVRHPRPIHPVFSGNN